MSLIKQNISIDIKIIIKIKIDNKTLNIKIDIKIDNKTLNTQIYNKTLNIQKNIKINIKKNIKINIKKNIKINIKKNIKINIKIKNNKVDFRIDSQKYIRNLFNKILIETNFKNSMKNRQYQQTDLMIIISEDFIQMTVNPINLIKSNFMLNKINKILESNKQKKNHINKILLLHNSIINLLDNKTIKK